MRIDDDKMKGRLDEGKGRRREHGSKNMGMNSEPPGVVILELDPRVVRPTVACSFIIIASLGGITKSFFIVCERTRPCG